MDLPRGGERGEGWERRRRRRRRRDEKGGEGGEGAPQPPMDFLYSSFIRANSSSAAVPCAPPPRTASAPLSHAPERAANQL